jgi:hypothetical protein
MFLHACRWGNVQVAQLLLAQGGINIHAHDDFAFRQACSYGKEQAAKWLFGLGGVNIHAVREWPFRLACQWGHLKIAQWLFQLGGVNIYDSSCYHVDAFSSACRHGRLDVATWLLALGGPKVFAGRYLFHDVCENGELRVAKWLAGLGVTTDGNTGHSGSFSSAELKNLPMAQWLSGRLAHWRTRPRWDVDASENDSAFVSACKWECLHMRMAMWMYQRGGAGTQTPGQRAFLSACKHGRVDAAQWVHTLGGADADADAECHHKAFCKAVKEGHLRTAKWLVGLGAVSIHAKDDLALRLACDARHVNIARWLIGLDPDWAWPVMSMRTLQQWSPARDAWIQAVLSQAT